MRPNSQKTCRVPLRYTDALDEPFSDLLFLPRPSFPLYLFFLSHSVSRSFFHMCLPLTESSVCAVLSRTTRSPFSVSFGVTFASFSPHVSPLLFYNQTLSRSPQIPSATPAFSPSFSICPSSFLSSSLRLLFPLPPSLFCSPAAHKNSSFLSPEDCSVA